MTARIDLEGFKLSNYRVFHCPPQRKVVQKIVKIGYGQMTRDGSALDKVERHPGWIDCYSNVPQRSRFVAGIPVPNTESQTSAKMSLNFEFTSRRPYNGLSIEFIVEYSRDACYCLIQSLGPKSLLRKFVTGSISLRSTSDALRKFNTKFVCLSVISVEPIIAVYHYYSYSC